MENARSQRNRERRKIWDAEGVLLFILLMLVAFFGPLY